MRPADQARAIADDINKWMRATKLDLSRLARWTQVVETLRRLSDDAEGYRRKYEHMLYDLEQERKCRRALEQELETIKQTILKQ